MEQISLLGCGWLGLPLAVSLIEKGYSVNGSTTSADKADTLKNAKINPYLIHLDEDGVSGNINDFLEGSDILIIDVPPKISSGNFTLKIKALLPYIEQSGISKVLFISSTSVYADDNSVVTEDTPPKPETESAKQLVIVEKLLTSNPNFKTTILRFGGLVDDDRQPVKFLAGKENVANPDAPVNLIHRQDCIGIIISIIEKNSWGTVFNGVAPYHPSRKEHYTKQAEAFGMTAPKFDYTTPSMGKTITSENIKTALGYNFRITSF